MELHKLVRPLFRFPTSYRVVNAGKAISSNKYSVRLSLLIFDACGGILPFRDLMMWGTWGSFRELIIVMNHRLFGSCSGLLHEHSLADAASLLNGCVHTYTHRRSSRTLTDSSDGAFQPTRHRGQTSEVRTVILEQRHFRGLLRW